MRKREKKKKREIPGSGLSGGLSTVQSRQRSHNLTEVVQ
jgi:hypothetical protein